MCQRKGVPLLPTCEVYYLHVGEATPLLTVPSIDTEAPTKPKSDQSRGDEDGVIARASRESGDIVFQTVKMASP